MRFALNATQVRAAKSGVGQYIHALAEAMSAPLAESCDRLTVLCSPENEQNYRPAPQLIAGAESHVTTRVWGLPQRLKPLRLAHQHLALPGFVAKAGFDVLHGASNFLPAFRARGCRYVVTIHDLSYHVHPERCPPARRAYWYAMTARTVAVADAIIADSENTRRDLLRFFPKLNRPGAPPLHVVPLASHRRFSPAPAGSETERPASLTPLGGRPYLLYVGTLEPGKNLVRAIEAFDRIADRFPDHLLVLAGDRGWMFEDIFRAMSHARATDRIVHLGHVTDDTVVDLMRHCEAFVYPSRYEGFGLPPLEAMACGAPVVCSNAASLPEVTGDAALSVDPDRPGDLEDALAAVLGDPALRARLRTAGLVRAASFDWRTTASRTLGVYRGDAPRVAL